MEGTTSAVPNNVSRAGKSKFVKQTIEAEPWRTAGARNGGRAKPIGHDEISGGKLMARHHTYSIEFKGRGRTNGLDFAYELAASNLDVRVGDALNRLRALLNPELDVVLARTIRSAVVDGNHPIAVHENVGLISRA